MEVNEQKLRISMHVFLIHKLITTMHQLDRFITMNIHHCNSKVSLVKGLMLADITYMKTTELDRDS